MPWAGTFPKTSYDYDNTNIDSQATSATQHDSSYSSSFTARGNVTSVSRWDVTDINNGSKVLTSHMTYDAAGSVLTASDPLAHQSSIDYSSAYAYAYTTTM